MANTIKIKNKTSSGAPTSEQMETKELVMHEVDNSLYYKRSTDDVVVKINNDAHITWEYLVTNWSIAPILNTNILGGSVYNYTLDGSTRYRFVPTTTYDPSQDAFYSNFDGTNLTNLISTRG